MIKSSAVCSFILVVYLVVFWIYFGISNDIAGTQRYIFIFSEIAFFGILQTIYTVKTLALINYPRVQSTKVLDDSSSLYNYITVQNSLFLKISGAFLIVVCLAIAVFSFGVFYAFLMQVSASSADNVLNSNNASYISLYLNALPVFLLSLPSLFYNIRTLNLKRQKPIYD